MLQLLLLSLIGGFTISSMVSDDSSSESDDTSDDNELENDDSGEDLLGLVLNGEELYGTDGTDVTGTEAADEFVPNRDEDDRSQGVDVGFISGGAGDDYIDASYVEMEGIDGGAGDDVIFAVSGFDYDYQENPDPVVSGGAGDDIIYDLYYENGTTLHGNEGNDIIHGGFGRVYGDEGDDILIGSSLDGGDGDDVLFNYTTVHGGAEHSTGGAGDDFISFEISREYDWGRTSVAGGEGEDIFNVDASRLFASVAEAGSHSVITDYDRTEDVIQIELPSSTIPSGYIDAGDYNYSGITVTNNAEDSVFEVTYTHADPDSLDPHHPASFSFSVIVEGVTDLQADELVLSFDDDFQAPIERPSLRYLAEDAGYYS